MYEGSQLYNQFKEEIIYKGVLKVKIKAEKKLNLPQLIEWGFKNDISNKIYVGHDARGNVSEVYFNVAGLPKFSKAIDKYDMFPIEFEKEITIDIKLKLVERWKHVGEGDEKFHYVHYDENSINKVLLENSESVETTHFYTEINNDLVLIWRDGKLVE